MAILKHKPVMRITIITLLLSSQLLVAEGEFNAFAGYIYKKDIKGIKELLAKGIDVNIREETMGSTPLIVACSLEGTEKIVELLIAEGADVNIVASYDGRTALIWAAANSKSNVELLLKKGAKVDVKGVDGMTAFIQSIYGNFYGSVTTEVCDLLLEKGADINAELTGKDATGWTAIMFATKNNKPELVKYLISKGADVNHKAKDGSSALRIAQKDKNEDIINILKAKGAK